MPRCVGVDHHLQLAGNRFSQHLARTSHGFYRAWRLGVRLGSGSDGRVSTRVSHLAIKAWRQTVRPPIVRGR